MTEENPQLNGKGDETEGAYEQGRTTKGRKSLPWRSDPSIMARMAKVERLHIAGKPNTHIAEILGVTEGCIRLDVKRLRETWKEHIQQTQEELRSQVVANLEDVRKRALDAAEFDEQAERAVLYGHDADGEYLTVERDMKGAAQFRGQKAQSLNVARQAAMDEAKVLGLVVEKQEHSGEALVRIYERGSDHGE